MRLNEKKRVFPLTKRAKKIRTCIPFELQDPEVFASFPVHEQLKKDDRIHQMQGSFYQLN